MLSAKGGVILVRVWGCVCMCVCLVEGGGRPIGTGMGTNKETASWFCVFFFNLLNN